MKIHNAYVTNIEGADAPDFCNAYVESAEHEDGTPFTDEELQAIDPDTTYDLLMGQLYGWTH